MIGEPNQLINCKFTLKEAETAYQPKIDPNSLKLDGINDDCLRKIASYMCLVDIINMGKTSTRFRSFTQTIYQQRKHFSFQPHTGDSAINETNLELILQETGTYIESIEWYCIHPHHLDYLSRYCPNVTELVLEEASSLCNYEENRKFFAKIEKLKICFSDITDAQVTVIASSKNLKSLNLECNAIRGEFFSQFKHSEIKILKLAHCHEINSDQVFNFVLSNKLLKFSTNQDGCFEKCLRLPSTCLSLFEELELNIPCDFNKIKLETLNFKYLANLKHLRLTGRHRGNCNGVLAAAAQIPALTSLTVEGIDIDVQTLNCLSSLKSLTKIRFNFFTNKIVGLLYTSLYLYLPDITEVTMYEEDDEEDENGFDEEKKIATELFKEKSICAMISQIAQLKYFAYSEMSWELLYKILEVRLRLKLTTIEIGISEHLWCDQRKVSANYFYLITFSTTELVEMSYKCRMT